MFLSTLLFMLVANIKFSFIKKIIWLFERLNKLHEMIFKEICIDKIK